MFLLRPIKEDDLDQLMELLASPNYGLTSLPADRDVLNDRIQGSIDAFSTHQRKPHGQVYVFVLQDCIRKKVIGTCAVYTKVGGFEPFYTYKIKQTVLHSETLGIHKEVPTLHLDTEHNGPSEIGSLYLSPEYRRSGLGRFLSLSRFIFMAKNRECFENMVIAEMRGVVDSTGYSPFWEALGRKFFNMDYAQADYLVNSGKKFIDELMPRYPVYIPLLPQEAQNVIARVHHETAPALKILESEGFQYNNSVDIFEAGKIVSCELEKIRVVRNVRDSKIADIVKHPPHSPEYILTADLKNMKTCKAMLGITSKGLIIGEQEARLLDLNAGDNVSFVELNLVQG